jgi:2-keto-4-pentenoate hydratase
MDRHHDAARLLLSARRDPTQKLHSLPDAMRPRTEEQAYLVQRAIMAESSGIGGWKVGSPNPTGPFTCAPLPAAGVQASPGHVSTEHCTDGGVEAEIAVKLSHDLPPRDAAYGPEDLVAAIASAHPAIEVLQSRYVDPDRVDPLSALADSLAHFGLVVGPAIAGWQSIDWGAEQVALTVNGQEMKRRTGNPGGDMLRLLAWLANHGSRWAGGLRGGQVVTTGSWTGKDFVAPGAEVRIAFDHAGAAALRFSA